jgi:hypothetical protein
MSEPYTYKPCPVCGKNDNISMDSMSHKGYYWVRCMGTHFDDYLIKVWDNYKNAYYIQSQTNHGFLILAAKVTKGLVHWKVSLDKE